MNIEHSFLKILHCQKVHTLLEGETIGKLSKIYGLTEDQLFQANDDINLRNTHNKLQIGAKIKIPESHHSLVDQLRPLGLEQQIPKAATLAGVPVDLFKAMIYVESRNCQAGTSRAGAVGCGQLMPPIISHYKMKDPNDNAENLLVSAFYLADLFSQAPGKTVDEKQWHSLMMYNWGQGNLKRWLASGMKPSLLTAEAKHHPFKVFKAMGKPVPAVYQGMYS